MCASPRVRNLRETPELKKHMEPGVVAVVQAFNPAFRRQGQAELLSLKLAWSIEWYFQDRDTQT